MILPLRDFPVLPYSFNQQNTVASLKMFGLRLNRVRTKLPASSTPQVAHVCFHCGLPVPEPVPDWLLFDGAKRPMCCVACRAAADLIIDAGFADRYRAQAAGPGSG
jgi:hypothetical protein